VCVCVSAVDIINRPHAAAPNGEINRWSLPAQEGVCLCVCLCVCVSVCVFAGEGQEKKVELERRAGRKRGMEGRERLGERRGRTMGKGKKDEGMFS